MRNIRLIRLSVMLFSFCILGCSNNDAALADYIMIDEDQLKVALESEDTTASIEFTALTSWKAVVKDANNKWITLPNSSGIGGVMAMKISVTKNVSAIARTATITLTCRNTTKEITVTQGGSTLQIMDESNVENLDKYYKPAEFSNINMFRSDAKWSWFRSAQSEHFFVFWESGFGDDPNADSVDEALRVDINDLLEKAEQFYATNIGKLKFAETVQGKSYLDKYKMEIYLMYQTEWLATGSGYDNTIGALWVNPSTCQPVGSTIAHEIGHSFQYQVYCDKLLQGATDDSKKGFRYGYEGSNGGNTFWEQCAQWQSFQDYPEQLFSNSNFNVWLANCHRHFEHEWMRYASYWLQYYWVAKHGMETVGNIWMQSVYPEDAISSYMRLYCDNQWETMRAELYDYAARMATFDIDIIRDYSAGYIGQYSTTLYDIADDYYQIAYADCPGTTGFNVIALNVPDAGTKIEANFVGLQPSSDLAAVDPGNIIDGDGNIVATTTNYNTISNITAGWCYGFVALKSDGTRVYGDMNQQATGTVSFSVPANTENLYLVVMGAPKQYKVHPWDEKEQNDAQWPYKVKIISMDLLGHFDIDMDAVPKNVQFTYNVNCDAAITDYNLGSIDLQSNGDIKKLSQAFVMQPNVLSSNTLAITNGQTSNPTAGYISLGLLQTDGTCSYNYTANSGFYCTAEGNQGSWSNNDPIWVEYNKDTFVFKYGHKPGSSIAGRKYTIKPALTYIKDDKQYMATFIITMRF